MHYGIFIIITDAEGREHIGRMVHNCDTWTGACGYIRDAYTTGESRGATDTEDGTPMDGVDLKALELECRPWGQNPPRIKPGQTV